MLVNASIEVPVTQTTQLYLSDIIRESCKWDARFLVQLSLLLFGCAVLVGHTDYLAGLLPEKFRRYHGRVKEFAEFLLSVGVWILPFYMIYTHDGSVYNKAILVVIIIVLFVDIVLGFVKRSDEFGRSKP